MFVPQEKSSTLIDAVNAMIHSGLEEGKLAEINAGLASLRKGNLHYQALQIEGMLEALKGDMEATEYKFKLAGNASGNSDPVVCINHATACTNLLDYERAVEVAEKAVQMAPNNLSILRAAFRVNADSHNYIGAKSLFERLSYLGATTDEDADSLNDLESEFQTFSESGTSWMDLSNRTLLIRGSLWRNGFGQVSLVEETCGDAYILAFCIRAESSETLARAEELIHKTVASVPYLPLDRVCSYICASSVDHVHLA